MSAICSLCGSDMTVQDGEGTAFCLSCENAGLHARIAELEATGPERDLAEQALEKLEWLAREWGEATVIKVRVDKPLAHWTEVRVDMNRGELRHFAGSSGGRDFPMIPRADALALLREKGAK